MKEMPGVSNKVLPSVSAPTLINWNLKGSSPSSSQELSPVSPAFPFTVLQLPGWRQRLLRSQSPLFHLQVHQLHGNLFRWPSSSLLPSFPFQLMWPCDIYVEVPGEDANARVKGSTFLKEKVFPALCSFIFLSGM